MPQFDLRGIRVGKFNNTAGAISYGETLSAGEAMTASFELSFTEGRLYAESTLAEYIRRATGGTISLGTKYIPIPAQVLMYGATQTSKTLSNGHTVSGLHHGTKDQANYVGVSFYAPDMIDGEEKYTCVFIHRALFGPPSRALATLGDGITFQTPTTSGEFMANNAARGDLIDTAIADAEEDAIAWTYEVMGDTAPTAEGRNAKLAALTVGSHALSPAFDANTHSYITTATGTSDTITATAADENATVAILNGTTPVTSGSAATWVSGANTLTVTVTSADGTAEETYIITVLKS